MGFQKKAIQRGGGDCLKKGGDWTICRFKEGLGKKEWGGVFEEGVDTQCTLC